MKNSPLGHWWIEWLSYAYHSTLNFEQMYLSCGKRTIYWTLTEDVHNTLTSSTAQDAISRLAPQQRCQRISHCIKQTLPLGYSICRTRGHHNRVPTWLWQCCLRCHVYNEILYESSNYGLDWGLADKLKPGLEEVSIWSQWKTVC